jgi:hypothetical protein
MQDRKVKLNVNSVGGGFIHNWVINHNSLPTDGVLVAEVESLKENQSDAAIRDAHII